MERDQPQGQNLQADAFAVSVELAQKIKQAAGLRFEWPSKLGLEAAPTPLEPKPPAPGKERWPVKTGTDEGAARVGHYEFVEAGAKGVVDTTVEELIRLERPTDMMPVDQAFDEYQSTRAEPTEYVIWRLKADIIAIKKESDGDLHVVLQGDSGETMVAEAVWPAFVQGHSPWLDQMAAVRNKIAGHFSPSFAHTLMVQMGKYLVPSATVGPGAPLLRALVAGVEPDLFERAEPFKAKVPATPVEITGVGFFDRVHGQMGVAQTNGIELHPILDIQFL